MGWRFHQYDVKSAFVHALLDLEIYAKLPQGFNEIMNKNIDTNKYILKINKALYGLKQSPRLWYRHLKQTLHKYGFVPFVYDEAVFISTEHNIILVCHVDDIIAMAKDINTLNNIMNKVQNDIKIQHIGEINEFLGMEETDDYYKFYIKKLTR